jgi:hypothetical protein
MSILIPPGPSPIVDPVTPARMTNRTNILLLMEVYTAKSTFTTNVPVSGTSSKPNGHKLYVDYPSPADTPPEDTPPVEGKDNIDSSQDGRDSKPKEATSQIKITANSTDGLTFVDERSPSAKHEPHLTDFTTNIGIAAKPKPKKAKSEAKSPSPACAPSAEGKEDINSSQDGRRSKPKAATSQIKTTAKSIKGLHPAEEWPMDIHSIVHKGLP